MQKYTWQTGVQQQNHSHHSKMKDEQQWLSSISMKDVVYKESTDELVSFTDVEVSNLSVPELHLFCVAHNISGNKNKESSNTLLLIVLCT